MLLACGEQGLLRWERGWQRVACPLSAPSLLGAGVVADVHARLAWDGWRVFPVPPGTECLLGCRWGRLALSGEADSISLMDFSGQLTLVVPAGVYPQGMCLLPDGRTVAVCGGAEGTLRLLSLPDLHLLRRIPVPGWAQQAACAGEKLCVLSLAEEGQLICRVNLLLPDGRVETVLTLPGLPGAVCDDGLGGWWVSASERLCRLDADGRCMFRQEGWGLITHMERKRMQILLTDSVSGLCGQMDASAGGRVEILYRGGVRHASFGEVRG